ncbi:hypothetical protein [Marinicella sp. W31]|uniref:hypothetical protein n=1 Tax=Marinicella sp. W31 TaxID=3023713 RepID=UPI003757304A
MKPCIGERFFLTYTHHNNTIAVMLELCVRSGATTRMPEFKAFANNLCHHIAGHEPEDIDVLMEQPYALDQDLTVTDYIKQHASLWQERIRIMRFVRWSHEDPQQWSEEEPTPPKGSAVVKRLKVLK